MTFTLKKKSLFLNGLLLLFSFNVFSQMDIDGRVVDELDGSPLTGATVYFNNTTIGTVTDQQGVFHFEAVRLLNTALVISSPGYDLFVYQPMTQNLEGKRIICKLHSKKNIVQNRLSASDPLHKIRLNAFFQNLLGISEEASKCIVSNKSVVYFVMGENKFSSSAFADSPIVIINTMLGYKISFNLEDFIYDELTGENYLVGYSHFEELEGFGKLSGQPRKNCYYGSSLHFYRSLVSNQLFEQGFGAFIAKSESKDGFDSVKSSHPAFGNAAKPTMEPLSAHEILYIDSSNNLFIKIQGPLLVQYDKNPAAKKYLSQKGWLEGFLTKGVESQVRFSKQAIGVNYAGVLSEDADIEYEGYWKFEKLANKLPFDYSTD